VSSAGLSPACLLAIAALFAIALSAFLSLPAAQAAAPEGALDARAWELVSPAEKNGGQVQAPGGEGAGVLQAAVAGGAVAYGSAASFGEAVGAPPVSQYLAGREVGGWSTQNLSPPLLSGSYAGGAYQLFSTDLSRALLTNGWACRGASPCEAENPPLVPGAPPGYRDLYLREGAAYTPLLTSANSPSLTVPAAAFDLTLAGASPDLGHAVISTCAALTADATEVPSGGGACVGAETNLYEWNAASGSLEALNFLPGEAHTTPGTQLAAPSAAISSDGSRVYFTELEDGALYLREAGGPTKEVPETAGGGASFQTASADGAIAFFTKGSTLYRYDAQAETSKPLATEVQGVLGASADGSYVYYLAATGLYLFHEGAATKVAAAADLANTPPATGTAQLSADGSRLAFTSTASLTGYANVGKDEVFLYEAPAKHLLCASCRPSGATPSGPSSLPAARAAGEGGPPAYKPRALSADGSRLFFDSADAILFADTDGRPDAYEWEAKGTGSCAKAGGCIGLISGGRSGEASFADASADGTDAYFLTEAPLLPIDTDAATDLYDARGGGGFAEAPQGPPCDGDECQGPAPAPEDPTPGTATLEGPPNPPPHFAKPHHKKPKKGHHKKHRGGAGRHDRRGAR
jgi:hypothetical protein